MPRHLVDRRGPAGEQVRIASAPSNLSSKGFKAPWRLSDGKTIAFGNLPWRSLTDMDREDAGYHAFVRPLAEAIARTVQASLHRQA